MSLDNEQAIQEELDYLYRRLSSVNNLIRSLEQYDLLQPKPKELPQEKSA
jgi:hypothetical protein